MTGRISDEKSCDDRTVMVIPPRLTSTARRMQRNPACFPISLWHLAGVRSSPPRIDRHLLSADLPASSHNPGRLVAQARRDRDGEVALSRRTFASLAERGRNSTANLG